MDVAVVLGAAVWKGGVPSPSLQRRIMHATGLIKSGRVRWLILTGGIGRYPPSEARVMRQIAIEQGVSEEQIILEEEATSTFENARACARIIKTRGLSSAWIVSDRYHLLRSVFLFRQLGICAKGSSADRTEADTSRCRWYYSHFRELLALPWSVFRVLLLKARNGGYKR